MSIEQTSKVDAIGIDKVSGECVLTISDHLDWTIPADHMALLQDKINSYLAFIDSGEILETYPSAKDKKIRIDVRFKYEPHDTATLDLIQEKLKELGFGFKTQYHSTGNNTKWTAVQITLLLTTIYFVLGNIVGYALYTSSIAVDNILIYLFMPYTFTWGLSAMVGTDWLSFIFIAIAFAGSFGILFPVGLFISKKRQKIKV